MDPTGESATKYWRKKDFAIRFMRNWYSRMQNMHSIPSKLIQFSFFLFYNNCPQPIWKFLSRLRISLSYGKTKQLLDSTREISIPPLLTWHQHPTILVLGADNCAYYNGNNFVRDSNISHFTNTINWYERFWNKNFDLQMAIHDEIFKCDFIDNATPFRFEKIFHFQEFASSQLANFSHISRIYKFDARCGCFPFLSCRNTFISVFDTFASKIDHWKRCATIHLAQNNNNNENNNNANQQPLHLFNYPPNSPPIDATRYIIQKPLVGVDTNSADDVSVFLNKAYLKMNQDHRMALIFGDEQLVALIWKGIVEAPDENMWVLPFPGEFHLTIHVCHAIFRLFASFLMPFASFLSRMKITIDFRSCHWHKQEDFLLLVVEGTLQWLLQLDGFPSDIPAGDLLKMSSNSTSLNYLLYFLFHFGLFYWNLRQEIRKGSVEAVSHAWIYCWPLFKATNKYQYQKLCLIATYIDQFSHPAIKEVLQNRLCNLKGLPGHCIGTDMLTEKVSSKSDDSRKTELANFSQVREF